MQTKSLGRSGPQVSVVGFGAWEIGGGWGTNPSEDEMIAAIHAGADAGMNWVDTAEVYGRDRRSEEVVGRALRDRPDMMLFTKVAPKPHGSGFTPEGVRAGAEASLKTTGRDVIDLLQLHWPDEEIEIEETWSAMASLVDDGLVRYIGVSNFGVELLARCEAIRHVDSLQPQFSMLERDVADEILPWCEANGTGAIAYGPLAYGLLTGTIDASTTFEDNDWRAGKMGMRYYDRLFKPGVIEGHLEKIERLRAIAERASITMAQLALAWVFHQPGMTGAIAGSRRASHTVQNAAAGDVTLGGDVLAEIAEILA